MRKLTFLLIMIWLLSLSCFAQSPTSTPATQMPTQSLAKDWIALMVSGLALALSLLSFRQKSTESRLTLRKQLTDLFEKLTTLNTEFARFKTNKDNYPPGYPGLLGDQRRFFVRQASFIASQIRTLVSPFEYLLLAGGHDDINDWAQAEHFFQLAISSAADRIDRGIAIRGYGRYLFGHGRLTEARVQYAESLHCFNGSADRVRVFRAETFERWAGNESEWGNKKEADRLLEQAMTEFRQLENPVRREYEVRRVEAGFSHKSGSKGEVPEKNSL